MNNLIIMDFDKHPEWIAVKDGDSVVYLGKDKKLARLIAAAPEMYATLVTILPLISNIKIAEDIKQLLNRINNDL